jgi:Ca2+-binding RTX toxin-like protein
MNGTPRFDEMYALAGNDTLNADLDDDGLYGQSGTDTLNGEEGNDSLFAGSGDDTLNAHDGDDRLYADGDDSFDAPWYIWWHPGVWENAGNDTLQGGSGVDYVFGYNGEDKLYGEAGNDRISALDTGDFANPGVETVSGGPGNDKITAQDGFEDQVNCGEGSGDFVFFDKKLDSVRRNCERRVWPETAQEKCLPEEYPPADSPVGYLAVKSIVGNDANEELVGTNHAWCVDAIKARGGDDTLWGLGGWDGLSGGPGDDILHGGEGNDGLFGDDSNALTAGSDKLYGGPGADFLVAIDGKEDTISCGSGVDDWAQIDQDIDVVKDWKDCERVDFYEDGGFRHWWRRLMGRH